MSTCRFAPKARVTDRISMENCVGQYLRNPLLEGEIVLYTSIIVLAVVLISGAAGYYFYRKHQRMLTEMSSEQRELYDAEKDYRKSVKKAEREVWKATKAHEARVMWAEGKLSWAKKKGQGRVDSYTGVHGNKIELWENRVRVPRSGTKENWMQDLSDRFLNEHYFQSGPVEARVENHGPSELYLIVEGDNFVGFVQGKPDDAPKVRELAVKINNASKSIRSVLQARKQAITQATADLEATKNNRTSIEEATERLETAKNDTNRLDIARTQVEERESNLQIDPSAE